MKSAGKARNNGLYRHIRTSKEIIRNLLNDSKKNQIEWSREILCFALVPERGAAERCNIAESLQAQKNVCSVPMYL